MADNRLSDANELRRLQGLPLAELDVSANRLGDLPLLTAALAALPALENLSAAGNPAATPRGYRRATVLALPGLVTLDHRRIRDAERAFAMEWATSGGGDATAATTSPTAADEAFGSSAALPSPTAADEAESSAALPSPTAGVDPPDLDPGEEGAAEWPLAVLLPVMEMLDTSDLPAAALVSRAWRDAALSEMHLRRVSGAHRELRAAQDAVSKAEALLGRYEDLSELERWKGESLPPRHLVQLAASALLLWRAAWAEVRRGGGWQPRPRSSREGECAMGRVQESSGVCEKCVVGQRAWDNSCRLGDCGIGCIPDGEPLPCSCSVLESPCHSPGGGGAAHEPWGHGGHDPTMKICDEDDLHRGPATEGRLDPEDVAQWLESHTFRCQILASAMSEVFRPRFDARFLTRGVPLGEDDAYNVRMITGTELSASAWVSEEMRLEAVEVDAPALAPLARYVQALAEESRCQEALADALAAQAGFDPMSARRASSP